MGIFEKTLGLASAAVGGIAVATKLLVSKKERLAKLDTEFAKTTAEYEAEKSDLESKIKKGSRRAAKKLEELEREYFVNKAAYENKRKTLLPEKSQIEEERETKEFEQRLEIEKATALHKIDMEKTQTVYGLELEKDKNYHQWDVEDAKVAHMLEMDKGKNFHDWDMEKSQHLHKMEMEKMELSAKLGVAPNNLKNDDRIEISKCFKCGYENSKGSKFCANCGNPLNAKKFCKNCGASVDFASKFCSECGQAL